MKKNIWYAIGLMSGTSLDGLDIAYVKFTRDQDWHSEILKAETLPYSTEWKTKLKNAYFSSAVEITELNVVYGKFLGNCVKHFIQSNEIKNLDFVASHGHTIFHNPNQGYTLQIGDGATLAAICKKTVVCDFRVQDVSYGGQGAPLVPIGDRLLFSEYDYCLNIGGFANVSFEKNAKRRAFDVAPVNIVLNHYATKMGLDYDKNGTIAQNGDLNSELLNHLNQLDFYQSKDSMGFELVERNVIPLIDSFKLSIPSVLRTYTEHAAQKVAEIFKPKKRVLATGGGVYNQFLIQRIQELSNSKIIIPNPLLVNFKEALIFAFLGLLKLENEVNCLSSVTGATKNHSSGVVFLY